MNNKVPLPLPYHNSISILPKTHVKAGQIGVGRMMDGDMFSFAN